MSLDVELFTVREPRQCMHCRECPYCNGTRMDSGEDEVFSANITHNLGQMADAAGIYGCLWRPEECGITTAGEMVEPLRRGLARLRADPEGFSAFNAKNGWGHVCTIRPVGREGAAGMPRKGTYVLDSLDKPAGVSVRDVPARYGTEGHFLAPAFQARCLSGSCWQRRRLEQSAQGWIAC